MSDDGNVRLETMQGDSRNSYMQFKRDKDRVTCILLGEWSIDNNSGSYVREEWGDFLSKNPTVNHFQFKLHPKISWDSTLVSFLHKCRKDLEDVNKTLQTDELPRGLSQLLELSKSTLLEQKQNEYSLSLELIDETINYFRKAIISVFEFLGEWILSILRLLVGRSQTRFSDFTNSCRSCGASALPIVTLISFLISCESVNNSKLFFLQNIRNNSINIITIFKLILLIIIYIYKLFIFIFTDYLIMILVIKISSQV